MQFIEDRSLPCCVQAQHYHAHLLIAKQFIKHFSERVPHSAAELARGAIGDTILVWIYGFWTRRRNSAIVSSTAPSGVQRHSDYGWWGHYNVRIEFNGLVGRVPAYQSECCSGLLVAVRGFPHERRVMGRLDHWQSIKSWNDFLSWNPNNSVCKAGNTDQWISFLTRLLAS